MDRNEALIDNYQQIAKLVGQARGEIGYKNRSVNQGACVAIGLLLAGLVPPDRTDITQLERFQHELGTWLDTPGLTKSPWEEYGDWKNYLYQTMMGGLARGNLVNAPFQVTGIQDIANQIYFGKVVDVPILTNLPPSDNGRPTTHAVLVGGVDVARNRVLVLSDLDFGNECILNRGRYHELGLGLIPETIDKHLLYGLITYENLVLLAKITQSHLQKYYDPLGVTYGSWKISFLKSVT